MHSSRSPRRARIRASALLALVALAALPAGAAADSWTTTGAMSTSREAFPATLLSNGQVLSAGGFTNRSGTSTSASNASERFDPATGRWLPSPTFADGRGWQGASLMADGRVLMTGGMHTNLDVLDSATVFDPATNAWSRVAAMPQAHANHSQVTLQDGRVLVIGGYGTSDDVNTDGASTDIALYSPTLNAWTVGASMPYYMANGTTTLLDDGSVLVAGGSSSHANRNVALRYFPATNRWRAAGSFTDGRHAQVAALLPNGKVLIAGGETDGNRTLSSAALYDPTANSWTAVAPMASARSSATATLLPNGKVLVAGGEVSTASIYPTYLSTAELFDPATNTWSSAPSMAAQRAGARATLLSDGRVLVTGGAVDPFDSTASAEIYTPDGWPFPRGGGGSGGGGGGGGTGSGSGASGTPAISRLALSATRFRAAGSGPSVTAARRRAPVGTTISYRDGAAATATFLVQRPAAGRRTHGHCVTPSRANRRKPHCTRWVTVGHFTHADVAGANSLRFTGRVAGHKLAPGSYRLSITARIGRGRASAARNIAFQIVR